MRKSQRKVIIVSVLLALTAISCRSAVKEKEAFVQIPVADKPNIIFIYADDLGYGDLSCYGASKIKTPNIDRIAAEGIRFTNAYASSSTCTPSRYSLMTGQYAFRKKGTGIAPGDAALIIEPGRLTLPSVLQQAGYSTGIVGKWHLGLGPKEGPDWNGEIKPGPLEIGFDYSFIMAATADRVPCVYIENHHVVGLETRDPISVSYKNPVGKEPTGKSNPELLTMKPSHGHDQTIVNGISRIGFMAGGKNARWIDEDMADVFTGKAIDFISQKRQSPFFLFFASNDIHVPRVPHPRFAGQSGMGPRGDVLLQLDWCIGKILKTLDSLNLRENTMIIFSSDNGPVLDDGYQDDAVTKLNGHNPGGPLRGGKYSAFEGGTRTPFMISWPGKIKAGTISGALISQVDLVASFAAFTGRQLKANDAPDSENIIHALLGQSKKGRTNLVQQGATLALVNNDWKYIVPNKGPKVNTNTRIELGNDPQPQLYNLKKDKSERNNVASQYPDVVKEMATLLEKIKGENTPDN